MTETAGAIVDEGEDGGGGFGGGFGFAVGGGGFGFAAGVFGTGHLEGGEDEMKRVLSVEV